MERIVQAYGRAVRTGNTARIEHRFPSRRAPGRTRVGQSLRSASALRRQSWPGSGAAAADARLIEGASFELMERTLVIVKPDAMQRGLAGEILSRLERRGLKIIGLKLMRIEKALANSHYGEHMGKPFFEG